MKAGTTSWAAFWESLPGLIWPLLAAVVVFVLRKEIAATIRVLVWRLRSGAAVKLGSLEVGAVHATRGSELTGDDQQVGVRVDDGSRRQERDGLYAFSRGIMLVHRIYRSNATGQLYDILIYLIPHQTGSLAAVKSVEYFFGHMWGNRVFPSTDRSRGFPVVTSAYGPFLCTAKIIFNDDSSVTVNRYIDFEMGAVAPCVDPIISGAG